jgi:metallo-beta-lactamase class B
MVRACHLSVAWLAVMVCALSGQQPSTADVHIAAAKAAADDEHAAPFRFLCEPAVGPFPPASEPLRREQWYAQPVKAFDNLYFVGQTEYSSWALTTSDGIILIDALYDYSVEAEVVDGLRMLGLDPARIRYVVVSHGHSDHAGGARYLQEHFGAHVIASADEWDLMQRDTEPWPKPQRDMTATDGQRLTLGDTTITLYITPGHTLGTISTVIPVKDRGEPHVAVALGGTGFLWLRQPERYITAERPMDYWFETYSQSVKRFRDIAAAAGADVLIANHTVFDGTREKVRRLATRDSTRPNPFVIGRDSVQRYLTVADECAQAGRLRFH